MKRLSLGYFSYANSSFHANDHWKPRKFIQHSDTWESIDVTYESQLVPGLGGVQYSKVTYSIILQRKSGPYAYAIFLPSSSTIVLMLGTFILPPELPERPVLSVILCLANYGIHATVGEMIPKASIILPVTVFQQVQIFIGVFLIIYFNFACQLARKQKQLAKIKQGSNNPKECCKVPVRLIDFVAFCITLLAIISLYLFTFGFMMT